MGTGMNYLIISTHSRHAAAEGSGVAPGAWQDFVCNDLVSFFQAGNHFCVDAIRDTRFDLHCL
jgi:hypothetical protein